MANSSTTMKAPSRGLRLRPAVVMGLLALLAPAAYLLGRLNTDFITNWFGEVASISLVAAGLGAAMGIPVGLFFGSLRSTPEPVRTAPSTRSMERSILEQIQAELVENRALFDARRGSMGMFARIDYIDSFWTSIKASGRLFVMQNAQLLNTIATAYYWLEQATHLEKLAYEAKYSGTETSEDAAERLIGEARLLDGQLDQSIENALAAIGAELARR